MLNGYKWHHTVCVSTSPMFPNVSTSVVSEWLASALLLVLQLFSGLPSFSVFVLIILFWQVMFPWKTPGTWTGYKLQGLSCSLSFLSDPQNSLIWFELNLLSDCVALESIYSGLVIGTTISWFKHLCGLFIIWHLNTSNVHIFVLKSAEIRAQYGLSLYWS